MLDSATLALARLDGDALEGLHQQAVAWKELLAPDSRAIPLDEVRARHRVFAGVVRATAENLAVLQRAGAGYGAGLRWDR